MGLEIQIFERGHAKHHRRTTRCVDEFRNVELSDIRSVAAAIARSTISRNDDPRAVDRRAVGSQELPRTDCHARSLRHLFDQETGEIRIELDVRIEDEDEIDRLGSVREPTGDSGTDPLAPPTDISFIGTSGPPCPWVSPLRPPEQRCNLPWFRHLMVKTTWGRHGLGPISRQKIRRIWRQNHACMTPAF